MPSRRTPSIINPPQFQPHPIECPRCSFCATDIRCPQAAHPYNLTGDTGLQCYTCSSCSHGYREPLPPGDNDGTWYVHIPIEAKCTSELMQYRVAIAEIDGSKATLYPHKKYLPGDDASLVIPVDFKAALPAVILQIVRERLREKLRGLRHIYELERFLEVGTEAEIVQ